MVRVRAVQARLRDWLAALLPDARALVLAPPAATASAQDLEWLAPLARAYELVPLSNDGDAPPHPARWAGLIVSTDRIDTIVRLAPEQDCPSLRCLILLDAAFWLQDGAGASPDLLSDTAIATLHRMRGAVPMTLISIGDAAHRDAHLRQRLPALTIVTPPAIAGTVQPFALNTLRRLVAEANLDRLAF